MIDPALFEESGKPSEELDQRKYAHVGSLSCKAGGVLDEVTVAYETWGTLNSDRSNAVLVCHALSGDSNVLSWWGRLVGPGKAIDTDTFFVIGTNALGGCRGTTGPSSLAPDGKPYGSRFPMITVEDMIAVQGRLLDHLGVDTLHGVIGGSMGGMQALEWSVQFPNRVRKCIVTASGAEHSPMQIAFNEVGRQSILRDPAYLGGDYPPLEGPKNGLAVARMLGHISFLSASAFESKFGRRLQKKETFDYHFGVEFEIESYLAYQGEKFVARFDANSLLHLTRAIDYYQWHDVERTESEFLFISYNSDWLYPSSQSERMLNMALEAGKKARWIEIDLPYGHDAFLLDVDQQGAAFREFLG